MEVTTNIRINGVVSITIRKIRGTPRPLKTIAQHPFETLGTDYSVTLRRIPEKRDPQPLLRVNFKLSKNNNFCGANCLVLICGISKFDVWLP
jgi:hypothetical protein